MSGASGLLTVGVDVGGTTTRTVFYDAAGAAVRTTSSNTPWGPMALVDHIATEIENGAAQGRLAHVGIGIPGAVLEGTVTMALNVGIESPLPIARQLGDRLGVPINVENDVNAAALGAHLHLDGHLDGHLDSRASTSLAYVSVGTGVAAGLVIDGQIVRGARGVAGEIGHIALPGRVRSCVCGQAGCVETVASGSALMAQMRAIGLDGDAVDLWDAADDGHSGAAAVRDDAVAALAWACYLTSMLVDVERVVIGGGVGIALGERLVAPMRAVLHGLSAGSAFLRSLALDARIVAAPPGVELGALGADRSARRADVTPPGGSVTTVLAGAGVITVDGISAATDVVISDGLIVALAPAGNRSDGERVVGDIVIDVGGKLLAPGFIDLQLNGGWGHDFTTDAGSIAAVAARLPATGVTSFLPTIVTAAADRRRAALDEVAALHDRPMTSSPASVLGLHFEGPLINAGRSGAHDRTHVGPPDPAELASWSRSAGVAVVTIAPEAAGALETAAELAARGVVVAAGHTACTAEQFAAGRRAGVTLVTHLFNAMAPFEHRNPGPVGATLADPAVAASLICDGIHVDPVAVHMAWNALGPSRTILVTDATAALGIDANAGQRLGGVEIVVSGDRLETADGTLAGSNLTLDKAVRNLISFTGCSIADAIRTVTANPAELLGLSDRGTIEVGARADLVVLDHDLHVERTLVGGVTAWRRDPTEGDP